MEPIHLFKMRDKFTMHSQSDSVSATSSCRDVQNVGKEPQVLHHHLLYSKAHFCQFYLSIDGEKSEFHAEEQLQNRSPDKRKTNDTDAVDSYPCARKTPEKNNAAHGRPNCHPKPRSLLCSLKTREQSRVCTESCFHKIFNSTAP